MAIFIKIVIIIGGTIGILILLNFICYWIMYWPSKNRCMKCDEKDLFLRDKICQPCEQEKLELLYKYATELENLENEYRQH